jgi:uncharacterized protein
MAGTTRFDSSVIQKLGYYVYALVDPRDEAIFYVGKGKGNRCFAHLKCMKHSDKSERVAQIRKSGGQPRIDILAHALRSEKEAFTVESAVIDAIGLQHLANDVRGHHSRVRGRMSVDQIVSLYQSGTVDIHEKAILIRINRLYRYGMSEVELYEATRGVWKIGKRREKADYAFAVFRGIVKEVYKITQWFPAGETGCIPFE